MKKLIAIISFLIVFLTAGYVIADTSKVMPKDDNGAIIQVPSSFKTYDETGTPQKSPLTVSNSKITIAVPSDAITMHITTDEYLKVSEVTAMDSYIPIYTTVSIGVAELDYVYLIRGGSSDATVGFFFDTL